LREAWTPTRPAEYELVPDVRADPITMFVVNLVVGVALSAVSALLAPKPRGSAAAKAPPQLDRKSVV